MTTHFSGPLALGAESMPGSADVGGLSAATTLTVANSNGMTFNLNGGTGFAITLPAATQGWRCKFFIGAVFSTDFVFTAAATGTLEGMILEAGAVQTIAAADTITLEDGVENVGDWFEFWSDGTTIFVTGMTLTALSVTPA